VGDFQAAFLLIHGRQAWIGFCDIHSGCSDKSVFDGSQHMFVEVFLGYRPAFCTRGQSREMLYGGRRLSTVVAILDDDER
jgi:hypothetical protein